AGKGCAHRAGSASTSYRNRELGARFRDLTSGGRHARANGTNAMVGSGRKVTRWSGAFFALGTLVLTVGVLDWAAPVLSPIGIAVLLAFLLTPAVRWLEKHRVPRVVAVSTSVLLVILLLGGLTWVVVQQSDELLDTFPLYEDNLRTKLAILRGDE